MKLDNIVSEAYSNDCSVVFRPLITDKVLRTTFHDQSREPHTKVFVITDWDDALNPKIVEGSEEDLQAGSVVSCVATILGDVWKFNKKFGISVHLVSVITLRDPELVTGRHAFNFKKYR